MVRAEMTRRARAVYRLEAVSRVKTTQYLASNLCHRQVGGIVIAANLEDRSCFHQDPGILLILSTYDSKLSKRDGF